jgi:diaminopimelate epimerase
MILNFVKLHSYGNDFVVFDLREDEYSFDKSEIIFLADRNFGIGCDHFIVLKKSNQKNDEKSTFFSAEIFNQEGIELDNSLGGMICLIGYLSEEISTPLIKIQTSGGIVSGKCDKTTKLVKINAGIPIINGNEIYISGSHIVEIPEDINSIDTKMLENKSKVFIQQQGDNNIFIRSIEANVGEVFTSSSSIAASAVYCIHNGLTEQKLSVQTRGSKILDERIEITWAGDGNSMIQSGKYNKVFSGQIDI